MVAEGGDEAIEEVAEPPWKEGEEAEELPFSTDDPVDAENGAGSELRFSRGVVNRGARPPRDQRPAVSGPRPQACQAMHTSFLDTVW